MSSDNHTRKPRKPITSTNLFETLEPRQLLSTTLSPTPIPTPTDAATTVVQFTPGLDSYANQDASATVSVEDGGSAVRITGNGWKKILFEDPLVVTENAVLSFDFTSDTQGEYHAIGVANDDNVFAADAHFFKIYGTDNFSIGETGFNNYDDTAPASRHFEIPIGQFFTGTFNYLTFIHDHDAAPANAESFYANVSITDNNTPPINFHAPTNGVQSYANQDDSPTTTIQDDGQTLTITGNGWKKIQPMTTIAVNADTVLTFDFQSDTQGEYHAIGLANSDNVFASDTHFFKLYGTDTFSIGNTSFADYTDTAPATRSYTIPLGQFFTGTFSFLTFINDHDGAPKNAHAKFSNIKIFDDTTTPINLHAATAITGYANQDAPATQAIENDGTTLRITGNGWKKAQFASSFTVTADTTLTFDFDSDTQGEYHAIGFANTENALAADTHFFKLYGSDNFSVGNTDFNDYNLTAPATKSYAIDIGTFFTGTFTYLIFINDHDAVPQNAESTFTNIRIIETP